MKWASILKILVFVGMFLLYVLMFVLMGAAILSLMQGATGGSPTGRGGRAPDDTAAGVGIAALVLLIGGGGLALLTFGVQYLLQIIGGLLNCRAPQESGTRGLGISILLCILTPIFVFIVVGAASAIKLPILGAVAQMGGGVIAITEWVLFIIFIHKVGTALDSPELRAKAINFAIWLGVYVFSVIVGICIIGIMGAMAGASIMGAIGNAAAPDGTAEAAQGFGAMAIVAAIIGVGTLIALLIVGLVTLIKYFGMMNAGIRTIRQRLAGAALA
jgi:hypothetical protein